MGNKLQMTTVRCCLPLCLPQTPIGTDLCQIRRLSQAEKPWTTAGGCDGEACGTGPDSSTCLPWAQGLRGREREGARGGWKSGKREAVRICMLIQTHSQPGNTALLSYGPCSDQYKTTAAGGGKRGVGWKGERCRRQVSWPRWIDGGCCVFVSVCLSVLFCFICRLEQKGLS